MFYPANVFLQYSICMHSGISVFQCKKVDVDHLKPNLHKLNYYLCFTMYIKKVTWRKSKFPRSYARVYTLLTHMHTF